MMCVKYDRSSRGAGVRSRRRTTTMSLYWQCVQPVQITAFVFILLPDYPSQYIYLHTYLDTNSSVQPVYITVSILLIILPYVFLILFHSYIQYIIFLYFSCCHFFPPVKLYHVSFIYIYSVSYIPVKALLKEPMHYRYYQSYFTLLKGPMCNI